MQEQWVKSPVAGLVSDIRITGVSVKGVTLAGDDTLRRKKVSQLRKVKIDRLQRYHPEAY